MSETKAENPWQFDLRIRARNLKSGALTEKELQKHISALPDLEANVGSFETPQPALDLPDDEDDMDDEDDVDSDAAPVEA
jgi:hypothetical protein